MAYPGTPTHETPLSAPQVHALRNATHYLSMVNPVTWDYATTFMSQAISSPSYRCALLTSARKRRPLTHARTHAHPTPLSFSGEADSPIKLVKPGVSPFKSRGDAGGSKGGKGSKAGAGSGSTGGSKSKKASAGAGAGAGTDAGAGTGASAGDSAQAPPAETPEERIAREKRRREEMERQAREHMFEEAEGEEGSGRAEDEEDEDDSVIEL